MHLRVPILMYHRVGRISRDRRYSVSPRRFEQQMQFLRDGGYKVINLETLVDTLAGSAALPVKSVAITFDDGFQETFDHAYPVLKRFSYPATFFLVSRLIGKTNEWMQREGREGAPLMGWGEARQLLSEGFSIGSHTASHPRLPEISASAARVEIEESKQELENRLGVPIRWFAYPYGRLNRSIQDLVAQTGYVGACSTQAGFNGSDADRFALRRLDIYGTDSIGTFRRNLIFGENQMTSVRLTAYYARRTIARFTNLCR